MPQRHLTAGRQLAVLAVGALSVLGFGAGFGTATAQAAAPAAPAAPAAAPAALTAPAATPCAPTARACVDLSAHRAWLTDGAGHVTYGPVAARGGSRSAPTPVGTTTVSWKDRDHRSSQFDGAPMPDSVFFAPGIAFHGGDPAENSNGCIHLGESSSARFFADLREGDRVQVVPGGPAAIHGGPGAVAV